MLLWSSVASVTSIMHTILYSNFTNLYLEAGIFFHIFCPSGYLKRFHDLFRVCLSQPFLHNTSILLFNVPYFPLTFFSVIVYYSRALSFLLHFFPGCITNDKIPPSPSRETDLIQKPNKLLFVPTICAVWNSVGFGATYPPTIANVRGFFGFKWKW